MKTGLKNVKGITLIALVITIIVLLILAGVSISMISSQDGILKQAAKAKLMQEIAQVEELLNLKVLEIYSANSDNLDNVTNGTIKTAVMTEIGKMGYETEEKTTTQATVKGLLIQDSTGANIENVNLIQNGEQIITIKLDTEGNTNSKTYVIIQSKKFEITINDGTVKISREEYIDQSEDQEAYQIKLTPPTTGTKIYVENNEITEETNIADNTNIKVKAGDSTGTFNFNVQESKSGTSREVSVNVEANQAYATKLTIGVKDNAEATITPEGTLQLQATIEPLSSTDTVTWKVESGDGTISDTGLLTANSTATAGSKIKVIAKCVRADNTTSNVQGTIEIMVQEELIDMSSFYIQQSSETAPLSYTISGDSHGYDIYYARMGIPVGSLDELIEHEKIYMPGTQFTGGNSHEWLYVWLSKDGTNVKSQIKVFATTVWMCFTEDTLIETLNGSQKIKDIKIGELVYSYNEKSNKVELKKVTNTYIHRIEANLCRIKVGNDVIDSTTNHPYFVKDKGWVLASKLEKGDNLMDVGGQSLIVQENSIINNAIVDVYNFEVEGNHNYFVGKSCVLVHNAPDVINCSYVGTKEFGDIVTFD